jgi:Undecaprenyl-phosphate galactose phosphotransferase WbaP
MMLADLVAVSATLCAAVLIRQAFRGQFELETYWRLWPLLGLFSISYALFGLYPGVAISPVAEIRTTTYATTLVFLLLSGTTFVLRNPLEYSRLTFFGGWLASLFAVPLMRVLVRSTLSGYPWWGYRTVVFGGTGPGEAVLRKLVRHPEIGLRPVAIFDNDLARGTVVHGVPVFGPIDRAPAFAERYGITRALVAMPDASFPELLELLDEHAQTFSRVFMLSGLQGLSSIGVETRDVSRVLAFEVRKNLLLAGPRIAKRALDLTLALIVTIALAPLFCLIALLIKLESRGPVLYRQNRIGQAQERFRVWKFRSMCINADEVLERHLEKNPQLREEWQRDHKLKNDPRITRLGRILRKTSLDELPQLLNILRGEMSLVGPRPIVDSEIEKYGDSFALYRQVVPGLTGLWQVSGRNDTTYQERVELDNYYVRNWSPWLDLYLLARTVKVVVTGYGAY